MNRQVPKNLQPERRPVFFAYCSIKMRPASLSSSSMSCSKVFLLAAQLLRVFTSSSMACSLNLTFSRSTSEAARNTLTE